MEGKKHLLSLFLPLFCPYTKKASLAWCGLEKKLIINTSAWSVERNTFSIAIVGDVPFTFDWTKLVASFNNFLLAFRINRSLALVCFRISIIYVHITRIQWSIVIVKWKTTFSIKVVSFAAWNEQNSRA